MSESPIPISNLNDFIFCPVSIYFHGLDYMLQYSVYVIENSENLLNNIVTEINSKWLKRFDESDSVYIFQLSSPCKVHKFGFARHEDEDLLLVQ